MDIFVINLEKRKDRLEYITELFSKQNLSFKRFDAIDINNIKQFPNNFFAPLSAYAISLSHSTLLDQDDKDILIFEDDVILCENFNEKLENLLKNIPEDWDCIMLGGEPYVIEPISDEIFRCLNVIRTHAYIVRGKFRKTLSNLFKNCDTFNDNCFAKNQHKYRIYGCSPWLAGQIESYSDVTNSVKKTRWWNLKDYIKEPCDCLEGYCYHYNLNLTGKLYEKTHQLTEIGENLRKQWIHNKTLRKCIDCSKDKLQWISTATLAKDSIVLAGKLPSDITGIVGIPRSGMMPASIIAVHLHLPLFQLTDEGKLSRLGNGWRGRESNFPNIKVDKLAIIEDTIWSGNSIDKARNNCKNLDLNNSIFCAVYCRPEVINKADIYVKDLNSPHILEWNFLNSGAVIGDYPTDLFKCGIASDLDGIICHDQYSCGIAGTPYLLPKMFKLPLIITGRKEKDRYNTEKWLEKFNVKYDKMIMLADHIQADNKVIGYYKGEHFKNSNCGFYIESDPEQANIIFNISKKPVVCPIIDKVFQN